MSKRPVNLHQRASLLAQIIRNARLVWRLLRDPRVPSWAKMIIPAAILYVLSPIDFMPDLLVGLGQLDDLAIIVLAILLFLQLVPASILREHEDGEQVIDATYRVVEDKQEEKEPPARPQLPDSREKRR